MAASSPDQQSGGLPSQQHPRSGKRKFWTGLLISIIIFIVTIIVLAVLTYFKLIPLQWYAPLFGILSPTFSGIVGFVTTTLADKDFQEALRRRFTQGVAGDGEKKGGVTERQKMWAQLPSRASPSTSRPPSPTPIRVPLHPLPSYLPSPLLL